MEKQKGHHTRTEQSIIPGVFIATAVFWSVFIAGISFLGIKFEKSHTLNTALTEARAFFQQITTTRKWLAQYGGVYAPVSKHNLPNPYLPEHKRDLTDIDGIKYTKINPATMTRQISELASRKNDIWFHLTSISFL